MRAFLLFLLAALVLHAAPARAQGTFDLPGPALTITVARGDAALPIAQVPALAAGDRLSVAADLPADQSARYLLVVAFLRGATNPPPKTWFAVAETWKPKKARLTIVVPAGAEQAIAFLAPDTGGGRSAVIDAVRGKPGAFVRAAQDLYQASLDRARLEAFVAGVARVEEATPERLAAVSPKLAGALAIRLNAECLARPRALQAACLTQNRDGLVLQTGRTSTLADALTGTPTEVAYSIAATREGGAGYYSPYIGLARDVARLFGAFRTANYQYIPALGVGAGDRLTLQLNTAPSFQNPKSVLVVPLPPIGGERGPAMRAKADLACLTRPDIVLPVEDAPLLFATDYARDLRLHVVTADGRTVDVPVTADAERGGLILAGSPAAAIGTAAIREAVLTGAWGFDRFTGPAFAVQNGAAGAWTARPDTTVIVGRDHPLTLTGGASSCVDRLGLRDAVGGVKPVAFKVAGSDEIVATLPLAKARAGDMALVVTPFGGAPATLPLVARTEASRLDGFTLHTGETAGELTGARLDQVTELTVAGLTFLPGALTRRDDADRLTMTMTARETKPGEATAAPEPGADLTGRVRLRDGRGAAVAVTIAPPRPKVALVSRNVDAPAAPGRLALTLPQGVVPMGGRIVFSLRAANARLDAADRVEIAAVDGSGAATLTVAAGTLQIVGDDIAVATLAPKDALGAGATGAVQARLVIDGVAGEWLPIAQVVRLPELDALSCVRRATCTLSGQKMFLIAAVAPAADFAHAKAVPAGFVDDRLEVPHPAGDALFLKLHDAPDAVIRVATGKR
ncbi:hypothetical protein ASG29_01110 [Sphingomonas sp. Leaf412]|uniref:hypothetical protein n=1 Tax=Sphingomonas sp. Leaf412 TaxID=1736370 RepID=UPI0006FCD678|nr:hypothetical protein [Sphingomonas sp. Leaf412]KQT34790.1 hypothetical protein ASG29_01110 [Sphingomonas sp. Leaf412]